MEITGILLSAGMSRRFGSQKLVTKLPTGLSLAVSSWRALKSAHKNSIAVVRHDDKDLQLIFEQEKIPYVLCSDAHLGMSRSLLTGIQHTAGSSGWIIALGDMPYISPSTIKKIITEMSDKNKSNLIYRPRYRGKAGNPVGLRAALLDELLTLKGDEGAREIIKRHINKTEFIDVDDEGIVKDIDTPNDLA
jgi:molybdenum cofactor cytidylyltransferase